MRKFRLIIITGLPGTAKAALTRVLAERQHSYRVGFDSCETLF
jgi:broad-specificity NMP kinase